MRFWSPPLILASRLALEFFVKARSVVKFSPVMGSDGPVDSLDLALAALGLGIGRTSSDIPQDLCEIFTHRLPVSTRRLLSSIPFCG